MPDPKQPPRVTERADPDAAPADPTVPRDDEPSVASVGERSEPQFAAPKHAGELGTFGRYRVLKKLGQGGMGAVYLGYDPKLERKVALKVMLPQFAASDDARRRFLREARTAAMVRSDHVVTIIDVDEERGIPFIAMQYLLGHPLDQYLKTKGELPLAQALRVAREAALGLAAAHELGLIHRDVKPGNVWLEAPKGRVKLLDFGLARVENDDTHLTNTGAVMGTPAYMSPEQARGEHVDHRTDLFSLGVMLYRLSTGKMPFRGATTMAVLTSLAVDTPTPARQLKPELPAPLEAVINKLLAKNPAERFQTAMEVVVALREIEQPGAGGPLPVAAQQSVPMAVAAQEQNVWEEIDASESVPVPLATPADTEADSESDSAPRAPKPPRKKPHRKPSLWPAVAAGAVLLAACAVLAVVLWPTKPNEPVAPDNEQNKKPLQGGNQPQPAVEADPDRRAAEWVISLGGSVGVNGEQPGISAAADLPTDRFSLTSVYIYDAAQKVSDAGLANFKDCKNLTTLRLRGMNVTDAGLAYLKDLKSLAHLELGITQVGDAGLVHFKDCKNLTYLNLNSTQIREAGLVHFKDCKNLTELHLSYTQVTDAGLANFKDCKNLAVLGLVAVPNVTDTGLAHFKDCKELTQLLIGKTKVTAPMVAEFAKAQPQCQIVWDGGTIEPTVVLDPDRKAAEYVLSVGGRVGVNGGRPEIRQPAELPKQPFTLTTVWLESGALPDAGAAVFKDCKNLTHLFLLGQVSDKGLANFANCKELTFLRLAGSGVTEAGLAHFKDCGKLTMLNLSGVPVTDAGLAHFKNCKLVALDLGSSRVTADGLAPFQDSQSLSIASLYNTPVGNGGAARFKGCRNLTWLNLVGTGAGPETIAEIAKAVPACQIKHGTETMAPRDEGAADRAAAHLALFLGGRVKTEGNPKCITVAADLPQTFSLIGVDIAFTTYANDPVLGFFKGCKGLAELDVRATEVTGAACREFAKAHPRCRIQYKDGTIEPRK